MLEEYLRTISDMRRKFHVPPDFQFASMEEFVLRTGRRFDKYLPRPRWVKKGVIKQCFSNCFKEVSRHSKKLIYCEGYAVGSVIPVHHAWLSTLDGEVIDPTWHDRGISNEKTEYWGIPFDWEFVLETALRTGYYCIIDNWHEGFPLLKGEDSKIFMHKNLFESVSV